MELIVEMVVVDMRPLRMVECEGYFESDEVSRVCILVLLPGLVTSRTVNKLSYLSGVRQEIYIRTSNSSSNKGQTFPAYLNKPLKAKT